jgi:hypothetical protein
MAFGNQQNIHVGRADIWFGGAPPVSGATVPMTGGQPTTQAPSVNGWNYVGLTLGGANFIYHPTVFEIMTEQTTAPVGAVTTQEEMRIEFGLAEVGYTQLKQLVTGAQDQGTFISLGGKTFPVTTALLLIAPRRYGGFIQMCLYNAVMTDDRNFNVARAAAMNPKIVAKGLADPSRNNGDQVGYINTYVVSA